MPCRGEDHENCGAGRPPEDKEGERRRYFLGLSTWNVVLIVLPQKFCKGVILWNALTHPNILKLTGVLGDIDKGQFAIVSEWMIRGNIMEYIRKNHVNRLELVRGFTVPAIPFTEMMRRTVAWGSPGSELSP